MRDYDREIAETRAKVLANMHAHPFMVYYTPDNEWKWSVCPLGRRSDPGPYASGCASYTVQPSRAP